MHSQTRHVGLTTWFLICFAFAVTGCDEINLGEIGLGPSAREKEITLFNDSNVNAHLLVPGEVRSPANRVLPGGGRTATVEVLNGFSITVRAENDAGLNVTGTCTFAEQTVLQDGTISFKQGTISFTGTGFICEDALFQ